MLGLHICHFPQIFDHRSNQLFVLFGGADLVIFDHCPNCVEHLVAVLSEILPKFEVVEKYEANNFASGLDNFWWLEIVFLVEDKVTNFNELWQALLIKVWKFLLAEHRLYNMQD